MLVEGKPLNSNQSEAITKLVRKHNFHQESSIFSTKAQEFSTSGKAGHAKGHIMK